MLKILAGLSCRRNKRWSPFNKDMNGGIERVVYNGETLVLSGELVSPGAKGKCIVNPSPASITASAELQSTSTKRRFSITEEAIADNLDAAEDAIPEQPLEQKLMSSRPPRELVAPGAIQNLIRSNNPFRGRHILSIKQFKRSIAAMNEEQVRVDGSKKIVVITWPFIKSKTPSLATAALSSCATANNTWKSERLNCLIDNICLPRNGLLQ